MSGRPDEQLPDPAKRTQYGRAWKQDLAVMRQKQGVKEEDDGTLLSWIVEAAWAHPFWHSYWICLVHLRPMPDNRETKIYLPGASHEIWVYAINPDQPRLIDAVPALLTPKNFAGQFIEPNDEAAITRVEAAIDLILNGELNPDTDAWRQWEALFGDSMVKPEYRR